MAAGFGGVHQYVGWLIFIYKAISKIRFDVLLGEGVGLWKTSQWCFPFQNRFTSSPLIDRYTEIGDDAVTLTDNDAGGSISMSMFFELHVVAVDDEYNFIRNFSILKTVFVNNILHLQISFIGQMTFFLLLRILLLMGIILQILYHEQQCHCLSFWTLSYFHSF